MKKLMAAIVVCMMGSRAYGQGASVGGDFTRGTNNPMYTAQRDVLGAVRDTFYTPCNPWSNSITFQVEYMQVSGPTSPNGTIMVQASAEPSWNPTNNHSNNYVTLQTWTVGNTGRWESFMYVQRGNPYTFYRFIYTGYAGQHIVWWANLLKR